MELPIRFPDYRAILRDEGEAFRRLSPAERFLAIDELFAFGVELLEHSPRRDEALRWQKHAEEEWQRIQKELFAEHAPRDHSSAG